MLGLLGFKSQLSHMAVRHYTKILTNRSKVFNIKDKKINCIDSCVKGISSISVLCCRMQKAGIPCPTVAMLKKHILVMSFIGKDQKPAPKLKDAVLSSRQLRQAYQQCVEVRLI